VRADPGALLLVALVLAGCAGPGDGPRPIAAGTPCAACGMAIEDLRFACEDESGGTWRAYDSIECLLRAVPPADRAWLADYDTRTLHAADSAWVVQGDLPSPMGGGYVAFVDRAAADEVAAARRGRVARWRAFAVPLPPEGGTP
jgi:nitrous oxide reductase accessory protein NosL